MIPFKQSSSPKLFGSNHGGSRKSRPHNNRKRTKGRNFYYDNHGKRRKIVKTE